MNNSLNVNPKVAVAGVVKSGAVVLLKSLQQRR